MMHISLFFRRMKDQAFYMIFFAAMFSIIGYYVPRIYAQYFDRTVYFSFQNPLAIDKAKYTPCERITMFIKRQALLTVPAVSVKNLYLVKDEGNVRRVDSFKTHIIIFKEDSNPKSSWNLPCNVEPGLYYYQGLISFENQYGFKKTAEFHTKRFNIEATPSATIN